MSDSRGPRLKRHNMGADLSLRQDEDLLIAHYFPTIQYVNMARFILGTDGTCEFAEYVIRPPDPLKFWHHVGQRSNPEVHLVPDQLAEVGRIERAIAFEQLDGEYGDPRSTEEYEERKRRLLRYWCAGQQMSSTRPSHRLFVKFAIEPSLSAAYIERFEAAWKTVGQLIDRVRTEAGPPSE